VNDLAALRMDERMVFESAHRLIFELIDRGAVAGLRIDHSDGLYDPEVYFERLQQRCGASAEQPRPLYLVTEKILAAHERLPESWRVHGTTGYEFAAAATAWLAAADEEKRLTRRYRQFTGNDASFEQIAYECKRLVMNASLAAEVEVLATQLDRIAQMSRYTQDFTRAAMREAIMQVIACFPVYRTYISPRGVSDDDRRIVNWAVGLARRRSAAAELTIFDFLRDVLLGDAAVRGAAMQRRAMLEFAMKFQQVTAPVAAKGVEDTAFYRYNRLTCLNEVGGDPRRFSHSSSAMHQENLERAKHWPHGLLATSTHDAKRSEDARARIAVLSELPEHCKLHLSRWVRLNRSKRRMLDDGPSPDREDEYLLYQALAGVWRPGEEAALLERLPAYMIKAAREAKRSTSWITPNAEYEQGLNDFVASLLANAERNAFLRDFAAFMQPVAWFGRINSLAVTALKILSPGVPDFYQGCEREALALVDPDNRRPVDFAAAARQLAEIENLESSPARLLEGPSLDAGKLFVTWKLLGLRRQRPELFSCGSYHPLQTDGEHAEHVFAFARIHAQHCCVLIAPRWTAKLMHGETKLPLGEAVWKDTRIGLGETPATRELLSGAHIGIEEADGGRWVRAADAFGQFPLAVMVGEADSG